VVGVAHLTWLSLTDPVGNTTTWVYDCLGRAVQETNELGYTRSFVYNAAGYLLRQVDRLGRVRQFQYDHLGRNTAEIWYNSTEDADLDQNRQRTISFSFDLAGQLTGVDDAEGNRTARFIDANQNGQLDAGDTDITEYTWDHRNRLVKVEHRAGYGAAVDRVIENHYDSENRWVRRAIDACVPLLRQKQCANHRMALLAFRQAVAHGAR